MAKKLIIVAICITMLITLNSCASIVSGTRQNVRINSSPIGARVDINGMQYITPAVVKLRRGSNHTLTFTKEGYEPVTLRIDKEFNSWVLGNLIFGGIIGLIIDFANGAAYKLSPDQVNVSLGQSRSLQEFGFNIEIDGQEYAILIFDADQIDN